MNSRNQAGADIRRRGWAWFAAILTLLFFCRQCFADPVRTESTQALSATVTAFYKWYLHALKADREPLQDGRAELARSVSKLLLREIDHRVHSAEGMDVDYFIQTQDYLDDWENNIVASKAQLTAAGASVIVELGSNHEDRQRLAVDLVKEGRAWKIRQVRPLAALADSSHHKR